MACERTVFWLFIGLKDWGLDCYIVSPFMGGLYGRFSRTRPDSQCPKGSVFCPNSPQKGVVASSRFDMGAVPWMSFSILAEFGKLRIFAKSDVYLFTNLDRPNPIVCIFASRFGAGILPEPGRSPLYRDPRWQCNVCHLSVRILVYRE